MKIYRFNKWLMAALCTWAFLSFQIGFGHQTAAAAIIIDHNCTNLASIPQPWLQSAKDNLHIAYGHTSHGSQVTDGMSGLVGFINGHGLGLTFPNDFFAWNNGGSGGALDLHDCFVDGDLGNPDRTTWAARTRQYLNDSANSDVNVIIWSWCGQVSGASIENIVTYLNLMNQLELDYPNVKFVYMTGHLDGSGLTGDLHLRNEQIRAYCQTYNKILFDFADIESYDPDDNYYGGKHPTDGCNYDYNNDGTTSQTGDPAQPTGGDRNWAMDWQASHTQGVGWYNCSSAHTQPLNANRKAYAAWWLWARLAGWDEIPGATYTISGTVTHDGSVLAGVTMSGLPGNPLTNASGAYTATVSAGWSGTVTPTLAGYVFTPSNRVYSGVTSNQTQDHTAAHVPTYTISGTILHDGAGLEDVVMQGLPGNPPTDSDGFYSVEVNGDWTGTVTPTLSGYTFDPTHDVYPAVTENQTDQDYTATHQSSVEAPGDGGGGGGGGCFINASTNGLPLGLVSFALLLLMTAIRHIETRRKAILRSTEQF